MQRPVGTLYGEVRNGDTERRCFEIPLDHKDFSMDMDQLSMLLGDEKARVSYSQSYVDKDYGNGFEVRVGVTLTCDQSEEGVVSAIAVASEVVAEALDNTTEQAKELDRAIRTR